jgi:hypothetical protein
MVSSCFILRILPFSGFPQADVIFFVYQRNHSAAAETGTATFPDTHIYHNFTAFPAQSKDFISANSFQFHRKNT